MIFYNLYSFNKSIYYNLFSSIQISMGHKNKRKNHHQSHNKPNNASTAKFVELTQQQQQQLLTQCLTIHDLLQNKEKALKEQNFCYLLDRKWLDRWKSFVGYDHLQDIQQGKQNKNFAKKHPGKINQRMTKEVKNLFQVPQIMPDYQYLNTVLVDKVEKFEDYIAVTPIIWQTLTQKYEFEVQLKRPIRKNKNSIFFDSQLLRCDLIVLDYMQIEEQKKKSKKLKKELEDILQVKKIQMSSIWDIEDLYQFIEQYTEKVYQYTGKIKIWRAFNYLAPFKVVDQLSDSIINGSYQISGIPLDKNRYEGLDLDEILKQSYTLIFQIGDCKLKKGQIPQKIIGYCQECCEKDRKLIYACQCNQVHYCSMQCRIIDQLFHENCCQKAFDSDDDEEYHKIVIKNDQKIKGTGLKNLGNTCYMNSCLQGLLSIPQLRNFFITNEYQKYGSEKQNDKFLQKFSKFCKMMCSQKATVQPWSLKGQIDYYLSAFRGFKQHDAGDFITHFITLINQSLKKENGKLYHQLFEKNFVGQYNSSIKCPDCHVQINSVQIFMHMVLPIRQKGKKTMYNYVVFTKQKIIRGKAQIMDSWKQMRKNLKLPEKCPIYLTKQGEMIYYIDQENSPQKQIRQSKNKDVIYYPQALDQQGKYNFYFSTKTIKYIANMPMKSIYGYTNIVQCDSRITTLVEFWSITLKYFNQIKLAQQIETLYKDFTIEYNKILPVVQAKQQSQSTEQSKQQNINLDLHEQLEIQYKCRFKKLIEDSKIQISLIDMNKHNKKCSFCNKKCDGCDMDVSFTRSLDAIFGEKLADLNFQIYFKDKKITYDTEEVNYKCSGDTTLNDCLELFKQPQRLDEENAWYCGNCDMMRLAIKQLSVKTFPKILILQFNRFKTQKEKKVKNGTPIEYQQFEQFDGKTYQLLSVIIHEGSMQAGHYWSICLRSDQYYIFNDHQVHPTQKICNKNAYILIYEMLEK